MASTPSVVSVAPSDGSTPPAACASAVQKPEVSCASFDSWMRSDVFAFALLVVMNVATSAPVMSASSVSEMISSMSV